jgi:Uma2 family endonuclease
MTISASPVASELTNPFHALAPLRVPPDLRLTPEQFAQLCAENREAVLELAADGSVIVMTPTGSETGGRNIEPAFQL